MLTEQTIARLEAIGVSVFSEDGLHADIMVVQEEDRPTVALFGESEEPNEDELGWLEQLVQRNARASGKRFKIKAFDTIILYKKDGCWTWRRLMWTEDPMWFSRFDTLPEIFRIILESL